MSERPLTDDEMSSVYARHWLLYMDHVFNTEIDGENAYDSTLGGYIVWQGGQWYLSDTEPADAGFLAKLQNGVKNIGKSASSLTILIIVVVSVYMAWRMGLFAKLKKL